jgi:asparagine synthase (glutamine-hydrolysing)
VNRNVGVTKTQQPDTGEDAKSYSVPLLAKAPFFQWSLIRPAIAEKRKRGRKGHHIDTALYGGAFSFDYQGLVAVPGANGNTKGVRGALLELMQTGKYRVVLSGSAGDEFLGGVPNPVPQLADLFVSARPIRFAKELAAWGLIKKRPWIHLFWDVLLFLLPHALRASFAKNTQVGAWIDTSFAQRHRIALRQSGPQGSYGFWQPSRKDRARTLIAMRRQLASSNAYAGGLEDRRYPYLDQDLIEFLLSIPASQLLRPGQRRSLMRRSLSGLVPGEILSRRTKGSVARNALATIETNWATLEQLLISPLSVDAGYVNRTRFEESMHAAKAGDIPRLVELMKVLHLEAWLRNLAKNHVGSPFRQSAPINEQRCRAVEELSGQDSS